MITTTLMMNKITFKKMIRKGMMRTRRLTSKDPFLNCMTEVLLMQVPSGKMRMGRRWGSSTCSWGFV